MKKLIYIVLLSPILSYGQLVGAWNLNSSAIDNSGSGNTGIVQNITWVQGINGYCVKFTGESSSHIGIPSSAGLNITGSHTVSAWVYMTQQSNAYTSIVSKESNIAGYTMLVKSNGKMAVYLSNTSSVNIDGLGGTVPINTWVHLTYTYDGNYLTTYINGVIDYQKTVGTFTIGTSADSLFIGISRFANRLFTGQIDNLQIYNTAFSVGQIKNIYTLGKGYYQ